MGERYSIFTIDEDNEDSLPNSSSQLSSLSNYNNIH
jgi:hypothetical protein